MTRLLPWKTPTPSVILGTSAVLSMTCIFRGHSFIHYMQVRRPVTKFRSYFCMSFADSFSVPCKLVTPPWVTRPTTLMLSYACSWHVPQLFHSSHQLHVRHLQRGSFRDHLEPFKQQRTCYVVWRRFSVMTRNLHHLTSTSKIQQETPFQPTVFTHNPFNVPYSVTEWRKQPAEGTPAPW